MNRIRYSSVGWFLAWPILQLVLDLILRARVISTFTVWEWLYYAPSLVLSFLFYCGVVWCLQRLRQRAARWPYVAALCLTAFLYIIILSSSYGVFFANGDLPDLFLLSFIRCETENAVIMAKDSLRWYYFILVPLATLILGWWLHHLCRQSIVERKFSRLEMSIAATLGYASLWYCWSGTASHGQCFVPMVRTPAICAMYAYNECKGINPLPIVLRPRTPLPIHPKLARSPVNVLMILNESLRQQNLQLYGYGRATTPWMSRFAEDNPGNFFLFQRAYANATTTLLAVPSMLTGISPLQPVQYRCEAPLLWEWAKAADMQSFYFTSHDLSWCKMREFLTTPAADVFGDKQTSGLPHYRDLGIDDHYTVECAVKHLESLRDSARPFLGVIQLNTNHYPYNTREKYQLWKGANVDLYDNTILEMDTHTGRIIDTLKATGQLDNTLIIFTSDHGEGFNEHGYIAHFYCHFIETVAVPLWIYMPPALLQTHDPQCLKTNLALAVQNLDIMPTILDGIGAAANPATAPLRQHMLGQSLLRPVAPDRTILITNTDEVMNSNIGLSSITGFQHYMMRTSSMPIREDCFDLAADPLELNNLWPQYSEDQRNTYRQPFLQFAVAAKMIRTALPQIDFSRCLPHSQK